MVVQHLDPRHESILAELLSEATSMDVAEVKGDVRVEPDRVYVIPPSQDIVLVDGMLKLVPRAKTRGAHMPIDSFLESLAEAQGSQSIGVILSGMGSDGTLGLEAIKAEGGITLAQEPRSAKNEDMPRSAIAAGCVDFVLPPEEIARELARLGHHPYVSAAEPAGARRGGGTGERRPGPDPRRPAPDHRRRLQRLQDDHAGETHRAAHGHPPHPDVRRLRAAPGRRPGRDGGPLPGLPDLGHVLLP